MEVAPICGGSGLDGHRHQMTSVGLLWWAPLGAASLHIGEEFVYPGGFAEGDRHYRSSIRSSITPGLHVVMNAALLFACCSIGLAGLPQSKLVVGGLRFRSMFPGPMAVPSWLAMAALLFSNAVFHLVGTFKTGRTSPGVRTGVALYMPMAVFGFAYFLATGQVSPVVAAASALVRGSYHLWAAKAHRWRARRATAPTEPR
jgi:hypothetical protein